MAATAESNKLCGDGVDVGAYFLNELGEPMAAAVRVSLSALAATLTQLRETLQKALSVAEQAEKQQQQHEEEGEEEVEEDVVTARNAAAVRRFVEASRARLDRLQVELRDAQQQLQLTAEFVGERVPNEKRALAPLEPADLFDCFVQFFAAYSKASAENTAQRGKLKKKKEKEAAAAAAAAAAPHATFESPVKKAHGGSGHRVPRKSPARH